MEQRSEGTEAEIERPSGKVLAGMQTRHSTTMEAERSGILKIFFGGRMTVFAHRLPLGKQALRNCQQLSLNVNMPFSS